MCHCLVISCVSSGFFAAPQLVVWLSLFLLDHTTSPLVSVFMASCVAARSSRVSDLDFL